jgi:hypothetical protein
MPAPNQYLQFPLEVEAILRSAGFPPGPRGYDICEPEWSAGFSKLIKALPTEVIKQALMELDRGLVFIKAMERFHKASYSLLLAFPGASSATLREHSQLELLRIFGEGLDGIDERVGVARPLPVEPATAELSTASYYMGAAHYYKDTGQDHAARLVYVEETLPAIWKRLNPRRYQVPDGYGQPKHLALLGAAAQISSLTGFRQVGVESHAAGPIAYLALARLAGMNVPTYFVGRDMVEALMRTDLPEKFALQDVRWPLPALHVCLPEGALTDPVGRSFTHLIIARVEGGKTYQLVPEIADPGVIAPEDAIVTLAYCPDATGAACWHHGLNGDSVVVGSVDAYVLPVPDYADESEAVADRLFGDTCRRLALQILLAMVARPELIEAETLARPPKIKGGREVHPGLWNPNFLGKAYRSKRQSSEGDVAGEGHKRTHWRRGHFRNYLVTRGFKEDRVLWIEPILVNAPK